MRTSWLGCRDRGVLGLLLSRSYRSKNNSIFHDQTYRLLFVTCIIAREITLSVDRSIIRHLLPSDHLYLFLSLLRSGSLLRARACSCLRVRVELVLACSCSYRAPVLYPHSCVPVYSRRVCVFTYTRVHVHSNSHTCAFRCVYLSAKIRVRVEPVAICIVNVVGQQEHHQPNGPVSIFDSPPDLLLNVYSRPRISTSTCRVIESLTAILHGRASAPLERRRGVTPSQCLHATRHGDQFLEDPCAFATARGLIALRINDFVRIISLPAGLPHL